jgi:hypothetical protein
MVHHFPMIARAQDGGGPASDCLFVASTGLRYLARNWKFEIHLPPGESQQRTNGKPPGWPARSTARSASSPSLRSADRACFRQLLRRRVAELLSLLFGRHFLSLMASVG